MYFSQNRKAAERRAGDEYLRRMVGAGHPAKEESMPTAGSSPASSAAPEGTPSTPNSSEIRTASLAMVYCPKQAFRNLYEPDVALSRGTLFAELDLPFEGRSVTRR